MCNQNKKSNGRLKKKKKDLKKEQSKSNKEKDIIRIIEIIVITDRKKIKNIEKNRKIKR